MELTADQVADIEFVLTELFGEDVDLPALAAEEVAIRRDGTRVWVPGETTGRIADLLHDSASHADDEADDQADEADEAEEQEQDQEQEQDPPPKPKPRTPKMRRYTRAPKRAYRRDPASMSPAEHREQRRQWAKDGEVVRAAHLQS